MAIGDIDGNLAATGMTPEQRAALKAKLGQQTGNLRSARMSLADAAPGARQTSFDSTNTPPSYMPPANLSSIIKDGPVGRATLGAGQSPNLKDAFLTGTGDGRSAIYVSVGSHGEPSFSNEPSSLNTLKPGTTFTAPTLPPEQRVTSLASLAPQGASQDSQSQQQSTRPASLEDLSPGGRVVPVPAQAQRRSSLADGMLDYQPGQPTAAPPPNLADALSGMGPNPVTREQFAALGSARNLGDGIGTASFGTPGDSARALAEGQKVVDQRARFNERQSLRDAMRMQSIDNSFTSVRDSSKPVTTGEMYADSMKAGQKKSLADAITTAQGFVESGRAGQAAERQDRQAGRLEDAMLAATAPNATPEAVQTLDRLQDPTREKGLARELTNAKIAEANARANQAQAAANRNTRNVRGLPVGLQKLEDSDVEAIGTAWTMNGSLDKINEQISDGSLQLGAWQNTVSSALNSAGQSDESSANYASFQATLEKLRNDSLRLNKGTQTNDDAVRAWNELITNIRDPKIVQQRIKEISGYNNQASALKRAMINNRRQNQGLEPLDVDGMLGNVGQAPAQPPQQQPAPAEQAAPPRGNAQTISTDEQWNQLPSGTDFIDPQGNHRRKP